jgi:hypothetical protein
MIKINKEDLLELRGKYFEFVSHSFQTLAKPFGFPNIRGMQLIAPDDNYWWIRETSPGDDLPLRRLRFPPFSKPQNYFEVLFGDRPKPAFTPRVYYENATDGFYSYYIENYKNLRFLPDWFSEFLQIKLNIYNDLSIIELGREALFVMILVYYYTIIIRVAIGWFVTINPYVFPFSYLVMFVDWIDEVVTSIMPVLGGFGIGTPLLFIYVGKCADYLNNLVFTMPYLPSEGLFQKTFLQGQIKNVLTFKDLPYLWYKYSIPNEIREFWYTDRQDILKFMQKAYGQLNIRILPDRLIDHPINQVIYQTSCLLQELNGKENNFIHSNLEQILTNTIFLSSFETVFHTTLNSLNEYL